MYNLKCFPYNLYQNDHLTELGTERYTFGVEKRQWEKTGTQHPLLSTKSTQLLAFLQNISPIFQVTSQIYI